MEPNQDEEPPNPVPKLTVEQDTDQEGGPDAAADSTAEASDSVGNDSADNFARGLGIAGIVIGTGGLAIAAGALRRHRQSRPG